MGQLLGNMGFGLSSSGEQIQLIDAGGNVVDSVAFGVGGAWPTSPNGTGSTLSLVNPQKDNALAENWRASLSHGTPGALNDVYTQVGIEVVTGPHDNALMPNYPNPFNPSTKIVFAVSGPMYCWVGLAVFDMLGREVAVLVNERKAPGSYVQARRMLLVR